MENAGEGGVGVEEVVAGAALIPPHVAASRETAVEALDVGAVAEEEDSLGTAVMLGAAGAGEAEEAEILGGGVEGAAEILPVASPQTRRGVGVVGVAEVVGGRVGSRGWRCRWGRSRLTVGWCFCRSFLPTTPGGVGSGGASWHCTHHRELFCAYL